MSRTETSVSPESDDVWQLMLVLEQGYKNWIYLQESQQKLFSG